MKRTVFFTLIVCLLILLGTPFIYADDYYISNYGDDNNLGTDPLQPWKSLAKVNTFKFKPGDKIYFQRGGIWRDNLLVQSGEENAYIEYAAYGIGPKPLILGSIDKSNVEDWERESENIWTLKGSYRSMISASDLTSKFKLWKQDGADVVSNTIHDTHNDAIYQVRCIAPGNTLDDIQMSLGTINIEQNESYKLVFKAKCSMPFVIPSIELLKREYPWTDSTYLRRVEPLEVSSEWKEYSIIYIPLINDPEASIVYHIGGSLPQGAVFSIADVKFYKFKDEHIYNDVGNIIFDNGKVMGEKVSQEDQLKRQNQFCYNEIENKLEVFSKVNPALLFSSIECAITKDIVSLSNRQYVHISDLALKYGSACGIYGENSHHIEIDECDISFIGGGYLNWDNKIVRYGNGITFYNTSHDISVEHCKIWDIYDAGVTNQGKKDGNKQFNIYYRYNTIWNCDYSFEYWNLYSNSETDNIHFEYNLCRDAGLGWSYKQEEMKNGIHVLLSNNTAKTSRVYIRNNTFQNAAKVTIFLSKEWSNLEELRLDNNLYIQSPNGYLIWHGHDVFRIEDFKCYQEYIGKEHLSRYKISK